MCAILSQSRTLRFTSRLGRNVACTDNVREYIMKGWGGGGGGGGGRGSFAAHVTTFVFQALTIRKI